MSKYTIEKAGHKPDSHDLLGLEIEETPDGFALVAPRRELSHVSLINLHGKPIMKFHVKDFHGSDWTLFVDQLSSSEMQGTWCNGKDCVPGSTAEADSWTASGSGTGEPGDDEAQSASAGYHSH
jgi:hypothetical protein